MKIISGLNSQGITNILLIILLSILVYNFAMNFNVQTDNYVLKNNIVEKNKVIKSLSNDVRVMYEFIKWSASIDTTKTIAKEAKKIGMNLDQNE